MTKVLMTILALTMMGSLRQAHASAQCPLPQDVENKMKDLQKQYEEAFKKEKDGRDRMNGNGMKAAMGVNNIGGDVFNNSSEAAMDAAGNDTVASEQGCKDARKACKKRKKIMAQMEALEKKLQAMGCMSFQNQYEGSFKRVYASIENLRTGDCSMPTRAVRWLYNLTFPDAFAQTSCPTCPGYTGGSKTSKSVKGGGKSVGKGAAGGGGGGCKSCGGGGKGGGGGGKGGGGGGMGAMLGLLGAAAGIAALASKGGDKKQPAPAPVAQAPEEEEEEVPETTTDGGYVAPPNTSIVGNGGDTGTQTPSVGSPNGGGNPGSNSSTSGFTQIGNGSTPTNGGGIIGNSAALQLAAPSSGADIYGAQPAAGIHSGARALAGIDERDSSVSAYINQNGDEVIYMDSTFDLAMEEAQAEAAQIKEILPASADVYQISELDRLTMSQEEMDEILAQNPCFFGTEHELCKAEAAKTRNQLIEENADLLADILR